MNTAGEFSPTKPGWYWWKVSETSQASSIQISRDDIINNKFKNFGGRWYIYPTFDEAMNQAKTYEALCKQVRENEVKLIEFLESISNRTFTPKKDIREFLASLPKTST